MQLAAVLLGLGNLRINNGLLLNQQSGRGDEMRMLTNIMLYGLVDRECYAGKESSIAGN